MTQIQQPKKRCEFADVARGIGILLVILGHLLTVSTAASSVIYSFHMPLFFILSGLFTKAKTPLKTRVVKSTSRLLLPYLYVTLFGVIFTLIADGGRLNWQTMLYEFLICRPRSIHAGQLWFLPCLFVTGILFHFAARFFTTSLNPWLKLLIVAVYVLLANNLPFILNQNNVGYIPLQLPVALMALVFYALGYYGKKIIFRMPTQPASQRWLLFGACTLTTILCAVFGMGFVGFSNGEYGGNLFVFLLTAICGSAAVLLLSSLLVQVTFLKGTILRFLRFMGQNSLIVFAVHSFVLYLIVRIYAGMCGEEKTAQVNLNGWESFIIFVIVTALMALLTLGINRMKPVVATRFQNRIKSYNNHNKTGGE